VIERPPDRVLIVLLGAIGDVVRALPLAERLRAAWPTATIAWAVEPAAAPMVEGHRAIDRVIRFERQRGAPAFFPFLAALRAFAPDLTLDLQRHLKSGVASWWSRAPLRLGFDRRNGREGNWLFNNRHVPALDHFSSKVGHFLSFADCLGVPAAAVSFGLLPTAAETARARQLVGAASGYAAFFVGSTWPSRFWFAVPAATVCRALAESGRRVVLIGGPSDRAFVDELLAADPGPVIDCVGKTSLREAMAILAEAAVAFGPDSGPMHIAAAVGTPVVSLWGATSPRRSAPWGFESLAIEGRAPCVPCYRKQCPIGRVCMQSITAAEVLAAIDAAARPRT
jgi:ADP-heptose:LPS heptosyltransferase